MTATVGHSGGCQCGAVRYRVIGDFGYPHLCHCRMCQKAAGNYFLPLAAAARAGLTITRGEPGWFQSSDLVRRGFCGACGTPLFYDVAGADFINVILGSLDDPTSVQPVAQSNLDRKMPWFHLLDALPAEPVDTGSEREQAIVRSNHQHPDHDTETWPPETRQ